MLFPPETGFFPAIHNQTDSILFELNKVIEFDYADWLW